MTTLDFKAVVKVSRCVNKEPHNVRVSPEILKQVRKKCGQKDVRPADLINYCLYNFLVQDDDRDLIIKRIKSEVSGNIRGNKNQSDVQKAYSAQHELLEKEY